MFDLFISSIQIDVIGLGHKIMELSDFRGERIHLKYDILHALKIEVCNTALMNLLNFVCLCELTPFNCNPR